MFVPQKKQKKTFSCRFPLCGDDHHSVLPRLGCHVVALEASSDFCGLLEQQDVQVEHARLGLVLWGWGLGVWGLGMVWMSWV